MAENLYTLARALYLARDSFAEGIANKVSDLCEKLGKAGVSDKIPFCTISSSTSISEKYQISAEGLLLSSNPANIKEFSKKYLDYVMCDFGIDGAPKQIIQNFGDVEGLISKLIQEKQAKEAKPAEPGSTDELLAKIKKQYLK